MLDESGRPAVKLRRFPLLNAASDSPASLVRHLWAVEETTTIGELAEELRTREEIPVVGIVDAAGTLKGVLRRAHFFSALGRPFGWDVLRRKPVTDLLEPVQRFSSDESLLLITEQLSVLEESTEQNYYAVVDAQNRFGGFFSPQDLLVWLSRNTQRDLATAQNLQSQLVKKDWTMEGKGVWAQGFCEMFKGVGGDFVTLRTLSADRWFGCVCDVSGKGIAASLVTTLLWGLLEEIDLGQPLPAILGRINAAIGKAFQSEKFVSGFFWTWDAEQGLLKFADMGHSHEYFWTKGVLQSAGDSPNLPLGITDDLEILAVERRLEVGDGFLVYTDGLVENIWRNGSDFPLEAILGEALASDSSVPNQGVVGHLGRSMREFRKTFPLHDDVTLVWFQRTEALPCVSS